ncbi:hypothetical protein GT020_00615 [Glutamicibacter soli]|uniref:Cell division protein FtsL n=1 Tax=Glutamicibacter soli TaxID=453836 RepID=A0A6L9FZS1_9MICC|nr:hypothetical protein [Glutamicibacter soli]NAZ14578.1 hypothetical protein [Glutamicibacter soli]
MTLSLVPRINETNKRSMVVTSVVMVMLFVAVIVALVLMNTSVAQRQYDIVSLRNQERALSQENQALLKDAQSLSAPQALARKASDLGLVAPGAPGLIDLSEGKITQPAEEAVKGDKNATNYDTLPLPGESINGSKKAKVAEEKAKSTTPETTVGKQTSEKPEKAAAAETKPETVERKVGDDGRPVFTEGELNGGTIPAPTMKSPTD